jgi:hypothetical protein
MVLWAKSHRIFRDFGGCALCLEFTGIKNGSLWAKYDYSATLNCRRFVVAKDRIPISEFLLPGKMHVLSNYIMITRMTTIIKTSTNPPTIIVAISLTPSIITREYGATVDGGAHL